jgi:SIR2-like domain
MAASQAMSRASRSQAVLRNRCPRRVERSTDEGMPVTAHIDEYLTTQFEQGRLIMFSGAGYSLAATDSKGRPLPSGRALAAELWDMAYPGEGYDNHSSLQDIFAVCRQKSSRQLSAYLLERLTINQRALPEFYRDWLNLPWRRIYTLNQDDLLEATAQRFTLPRRIDSINGLAHTEQFSRSRIPDALEIVYLNGRISDGLENVTFSTSQYAERASGPEPLYQQLATDIVAFPVVFVGTPLEEPLLWQYLEMRGKRGERGMRELRPRSFLVTTSIARAKEDLLASYNVEIVRMTAQEFADAHLKALARTTAAGLVTLRQRRQSVEGSPKFVEPSSTARTRPSMFLLGEEPSFLDIQEGLAIERSVDQHLRDIVAAHSRTAAQEPRIVLLGGTAGSGKSTSLMRLGLRLVAEGKQVGLLDRAADVSPISLKHWADALERPVSLFIDDVDRYGPEGPRLLRTLLSVPNIACLVVATRSAKMDRIVGSALVGDERVIEVVMPPLTDDDVNKLLDVLAKDRKLGKLRELSRGDQREALKKKCGRQLLVAMLEATSSQSLEDKVYSEWQELSDVERLVYEAVAIAFTHRFPLPKSSLLISLQDVSNDALNAVDKLTRRHLIVQEGAAYRPRHRLIAETLVDRLVEENPRALAKVLARITFAAAVEATPPPDRNRPEWRYLISLLNHARLLRQLRLDGAQLVYQEVESVLVNDHNYWLQRGSLELEDGNVRLAENYLSQARALDPHDFKVQTAYAHMQIKLACAEPTSTSSDRLIDEAMATLEEQISSRGQIDAYPYHVLGSQCLAWTRRGQWTSTQKEHLLQRVVGRVQEGVTGHPRAGELRSLLRDLRFELIAIRTGLHAGPLPT